MSAYRGEELRESGLAAVARIRDQAARLEEDVVEFPEQNVGIALRDRGRLRCRLTLQGR